MANVFLKAETIARTGVGLLQRDLVLPRLMTRLGRADFAGQKNDRVTMRVPAILTAREYEFRTRTNPIVMDEIEEDSIAVPLDKHPYSAVRVTDEELTLDITNFAAQVLNTQIRAVAEKLETYAASAFSDAPYHTDNVIAMANTDEPRDVAVEARRLLNVRNVPTGDRIALLGANVEAHFLKSDHLTKVNESGTDEALRDAIIGRLAGFTVLGNVNSIDPNQAYFFHRSAYLFANVAPVVPDGAVAGAGVAYEGLALRWIRDYDPSYLSDRSVVSSYAGSGYVTDGPELDLTADAVDNPTPTMIRAVRVNFTP